MLSLFHSKKEGEIKRTTSAMPGILGGNELINGFSYVTSDIKPTIKLQTVDISESSKAQVLEFSPNGSMLATGHVDKSIKFWDCDLSLSQKYSLSVSSEVTQITFSNRGKMATSDNLNQLNIYSMWPPMREQQIYTKGRINHIAFAKSRYQVATACDNRCIQIWDLTRKNSSAMSYVCALTCNCVEFPDSDSFMVTGHTDGKVRLWDLNSRRVACESGNAQVESITGVRTFSHGTSILAVSKDHVMIKYDKRRMNEPVMTYSSDEFFCTNRRVRISLSNNQRYAAVCSAGNRVCIFDLSLNEGATMLDDSDSLFDLQW